MDDFEIRKERWMSQGCKKLVRERETYFRTMEQGYSNREAWGSRLDSQGPLIE